jgi:hypothetical protein
MWDEVTREEWPLQVQEFHLPTYPSLGLGHARFKEHDGIFLKPRFRLILVQTHQPKSENMMDIFFEVKVWVDTWADTPYYKMLMRTCDEGSPQEQMDVILGLQKDLVANRMTMVQPIVLLPLWHTQWDSHTAFDMAMEPSLPMELSHIDLCGPMWTNRVEKWSLIHHGQEDYKSQVANHQKQK